MPFSITQNRGVRASEFRCWAHRSYIQVGSTRLSVPIYVHTLQLEANRDEVARAGLVYFTRTLADDAEHWVRSHRP